MGVFTLADFRNALSTVLGDRGIGNERLDLWITMGYTEVATSVDHHALVTCAYLNTVIGETKYVLPTAMLGMEVLLDHTSERTLLRTGIDNLKTYAESEEGEPKLWSRLGNGFVIWPVPDAVYRLEAVFYKEMARLTEETDTTALTATWDNAIYLLSAHYALAALGETEQAAIWFNRATGYIRSRLTDDDYAASSPSMGVTVARSYEDLMTHRKYL